MRKDEESFWEQKAKELDEKKNVISDCRRNRDLITEELRKHQPPKLSSRYTSSAA
jgi:hypothetical protein